MASPRFAPSWRLASRALRCRPTAAPPCFTSRALVRQNQPQRRLFASEPPRGSSNSSNSSTRSSSSSSRVKFWPFVAIIALGSAGYVALVNRRKDMPPPADAPQLPPPSDRPTPAFSPDAVTVVFVLGGPGAGKGTQCQRLVARHGFTHLSAGDLLRAEQDRPGSQFGHLIRDYIKNGQIVPMEVTIQLLENAMAAVLAAARAAEPANPPSGRFLIDGFPRKMDQALRFEHDVCPAQCVLFYDCPEHVMERRLLERGKTSGRADDNADSIRKRFRTFVDTSMPVVDHYDKEAKVIKIDATASPDDVFAATEKRLADRFGPGFLNK